MFGFGALMDGIITLTKESRESLYHTDLLMTLQKVHHLGVRKHFIKATEFANSLISDILASSNMRNEFILLICPPVWGIFIVSQTDRDGNMELRSCTQLLEQTPENVETTFEVNIEMRGIWRHLLAKYPLF